MGVKTRLNGASKVNRQTDKQTDRHTDGHFDLKKKIASFVKKLRHHQAWGWPRDGYSEGLDLGGEESATNGATH